MSNSSSCQGFATHAMPSALWAGHSSTALQPENGRVLSKAYKLRIQQRRTSRFGSSSSSSSSYSRRPAARGHLPFASITGEAAGTVKPIFSANNLYFGSSVPLASSEIGSAAGVS
jgi:hypothetical protein